MYHKNRLWNCVQNSCRKGDMNKVKINKKSVTTFLGNNAIMIILALIVVGVGIYKQNFLTFDNFKIIFINSSARFIIALGISGCLITKGTDLSAGRIAGIGGCIAATLLQRPDYANKHFANLPELPLLLVIVIAVAVCLIIGFMNGFIVSKFKVPPFIATLGMQQVIYGICLVYTRAQPIGALRKDFTDIANKTILDSLFGIKFAYDIPNLIIIAAIVGAIIWFLYNMTKHGKYMYAIGGNEAAAEVSGVNTAFAKIKIYALAGALYGLAGLLLAAKAGSASVNLGQGYELEAIAACTIGGVSTTGGVGKVSGILLGVLVFELLKSAMLFMKIDPSYQYVVQGIVIVVAVAFDIRKYIAKK